MFLTLARRVLGLCGVALLLAAPAAAQSGLVAAYGFDEGTGTAAFDASGNGNQGAIGGATWTAAGKFGSALSFDGLSSMVTVNDAPLLSLTTAMTLEAWIKTSSPENWRCVIMKERSGGLSYALYGGEEAGKPSGYIRRSSDIDATGSSVLPVNTWVHVATTYDGATLRVYVNGTQTGSRAVTGSIVTSTSPLRIGGNSVWREYFSGLIDEVRIYNRALSAAEIQADMTTPIDAPTSGQTYAIRGAISPAAAGNGATVKLSGARNATTTADANGNFEFAGLPNGSYTVTPTRSDATYSPTSQAVSVTDADATANFTGTATTSPDVVGLWGAPFDLGLVAVNMVMLHTGKVLMFSGSFESTWTERVWDPTTGGITLVPNPYYNLFCSGHAQLADGRILIAGGYDSKTFGAANANIFDPVKLSWTALPNMAYRRWYPTVTTMPDGKMLVMSGAQACEGCLADVPEMFDPATNQFTQMTSARLGIWYYPFMFVQPDGRVLSAGSNEQAFETRLLDVKTGTWTMVDPVVRDGHSAVMYQPGKILKTGTATDAGIVGSAGSTAYVLDMTQPAPAWRLVSSMHYPRAFQNMTLLPDGTVLVTGGSTSLDGYDPSKAVFAAELWSPATESFQLLSSGVGARLYHSTALLLPDARVLIAGSGNVAPAPNETRGEIFSPPYLFKGARPAITSAPDLVQYGASFSVETPDAASIASVALIRPGAVTHAFDEDQRFMNLSFTVGSGGLTIQAPANANLAPPGYYMLFLVNSAGVPSVASFIHLPAPQTDTEAPSAPGGLTGQGGIGSVALTWSASTDNTGVALYNIHRSTVSGFTPSTANRVAQGTSTSYAASNVPAGTYYYVVTAQDVAGNVSTPSNEAAVTVLADTTAPSVSITSPADQSTVSATITLSATASDDIGVAGVQFLLDGAALGAERVSAPYSISWNSGSVANGTHTISATARDAAGNRTTATVSVTVSNTSVPATGLVGAYAFDEGSGTQTADASGFANNGTLKNTVWSASGHTGSALTFDGASSWVTIADSNSLDLTAGMTIEAWVRPSVGSGWRAVILKERPGGLAYALYSANGASRPGGWVNHGSGSDYSVVGTAAVALNAWTHLAVTYDGAALRFYTNGVLVKTKTGVPSIGASTGALRIGGNAVWGEYFSGLIDDVRIYNRALSATEIQTDMNTPVR